MDQPAAATDYTAFVQQDGAWYLLYLLTDGMRCANCAFLIENHLNKQVDVQARMNLTTKRLALRWRGSAARGNQLVQEATALGYKFTPFDPKQAEGIERREERFLLHCLAVAGFATGNIMLLSVPLWSTTFATMGIETRELLYWVMALIALPTVIYAGRPFFYAAWEALRHGRTNMDVPISVALILTSGMSLFELMHRGEHAYFDSVVMLVFLLLIGRYLDRRTRGRARAAAQDLLALMAGSATVLVEGQPKLLPIKELQNGMLLQVAVGEKIAVDGVVETGSSEIDPSAITGETLTQVVQPGSRVIGGMINLLAPLTVRITANSSQSLLADIVKLMEKAEQGHAKYVRLADRIARFYTPVVHVLALGTFLVWVFVMGQAWQPSLLIAMTVLIITCPCALGLAVPAVQVLASSRLFKRGMLMKSADALERLAAVDTILFDKTGTLTLGKPRLINQTDLSTEKLRLAASIAQYSRHPLAQAVVAAAAGMSFASLEVKEHPGQGLEAIVNGKTIRLGKRDWCGDSQAPADDAMELWMNNGQECVRLLFIDELKADAKATIGLLKRQGYDLYLLSGDRSLVAAATAKNLGIPHAQGQLSPIDKCAVLEDLKRQGKRVLMVGDGLNDAAALSAAWVSMSPASAMDITQNAADIVFQGVQLAPVAEALATAQHAHRLVQQNFWISLMYNLLAVPLAMMGYVTPLLAALAMSSSSILVVLNAQRVNFRK